MKYRTRIKYTSEQKTEIWSRWEKGESMTSIGRLFDDIVRTGEFSDSFDIHYMTNLINRHDHGVIDRVLRSYH